MRTPRTRRVAGATAALVLSALLAGCGDDEPSADPTDEPTSTESSGSTGSTDATVPTEPTESTETTEPTEPSEPTQSSAPVEGETVELDALTVTIPEFYEVEDDPGDQGLSAGRRGVSLPAEEVVLTSVFVAGAETFESVYRAHLGISSYTRTPERLPDVTVDGVRLWHIDEPITSLIHHQAWGGVVGDYTFTLEMGFADDFPEDQEQALVDALLGSIEWKV